MTGCNHGISPEEREKARGEYTNNRPVQIYEHRVASTFGIFKRSAALTGYSLCVDFAARRFVVDGCGDEIC